MIHTLWLLALSSFLWGCAAIPHSTQYYIEPTTEYEIVTEKRIDKPFEEVWDGLVENLSKSFFIINNIEKTSRIINVSFSTDRAEQYVDCGETTRTFSRGSVNETYQYEVASQSTYKEGGTGGRYNNLPYVMTVNRKPSLKGRSNIYIAPEGDGTIVTVNTKYIMTLDDDGYVVSENPYGAATRQDNLPSEKKKMCNFNTNATGKIQFYHPQKGRVEILCRSKGILEKEVLALID